MNNKFKAQTNVLSWLLHIKCRRRYPSGSSSKSKPIPYALPTSSNVLRHDDIACADDITPTYSSQIQFVDENNEVKTKAASQVVAYGKYKSNPFDIENVEVFRCNKNNIVNRNKV